MAEFPTFKGSSRDLDLGLGHTAYRHVSLVDLYLHVHQISLKSKKIFVDGHLRTTLLGRLGGVDLINKRCL